MLPRRHGRQLVRYPGSAPHGSPSFFLAGILSPRLSPDSSYCDILHFSSCNINMPDFVCSQQKGQMFSFTHIFPGYVAAFTGQRLVQGKKKRRPGRIRAPSLYVMLFYSSLSSSSSDGNRFPGHALLNPLYLLSSLYGDS